VSAALLLANEGERPEIWFVAVVVVVLAVRLLRVAPPRIFPVVVASAIRPSRHVDTVHERGGGQSR
jgi:hypothetical protein